MVGIRNSSLKDLFTLVCYYIPALAIVAFNHQIHSKPRFNFIVTAFRNFLIDTYSVELSIQEDIEEWTTFIMSCKEGIVDSPVVVHTSVKGKSVTSTSLQLPAVDSSSSQSFFQPVLKQAAPKVVDLSTETSASDNTIPTILSFAFDSTSVRFFFELSEMEFTLVPTSDR